MYEAEALLASGSTSTDRNEEIARGLGQLVQACITDAQLRLLLIEGIWHVILNESCDEDCEKVSDTGKSDPHGDSGRALDKADKRVKELEKQLEGANKKNKKKIKQKIQNIIKDARKKKKGETHWR